MGSLHVGVETHSEGVCLILICIHPYTKKTNSMCKIHKNKSTEKYHFIHSWRIAKYNFPPHFYDDLFGVSLLDNLRIVWLLVP